MFASVPQDCVFSSFFKAGQAERFFKSVVTACGWLVGTLMFGPAAHGQNAGFHCSAIQEPSLQSSSPQNSSPQNSADQAAKLQNLNFPNSELRISNAPIQELPMLDDSARLGGLDPTIVAGETLPDGRLSTLGRSGSARPIGLPLGLEAEWLPGSGSGLVATKASFKIPLLFARVDGAGPPPMVKLSYGYTDLFAARSYGLPANLHEASIGLSWMRRFNARWSARTMLGVAYATDHDNTSSDAWQFRGGAFSIFQANEKWQWTFGAIALGRSDLPVVPAIGAIWTPDSRSRIEFLLPQPKAKFLMVDNGRRQQWVYFGGGINGSTWAYERSNQVDDQLTYRDLRIMAGWESRPTPPPGVPFAPGRKFGLEIGYAFSRDFEFLRESVTAGLPDAVLLRFTTRY